MSSAQGTTQGTTQDSHHPAQAQHHPTLPHLMATTSAFERMKKTVADGNYYEAQQLLKILYFRNYTQHKIEVAKEILVEGALIMLKANQTTCATELVNLLLTLYVDSSVIVDANSVDTILQLANLFPKGDKGKISILKAVLQWANERHKNGHPFIHEQLARSYVEIHEHYLRSNQPREFASMLVAWANQGYASEKDLYIARSVLMYLSHGNLKDAKVIYQIFVNSLPPLPSQISPLINFLRLLLSTLEFKTYPCPPQPSSSTRDREMFDVLRKKYKSSLARDPLLNQYLDHIAQLYYSRKPTNSSAAGGGLGNFISDLFSNFMSSDIELGAEDVD